MKNVLLLVFISHNLIAQGPLDGYLKGKGVLDIAPSFSFNRATKLQGANGVLYQEAYQGQMLSLFAEYGLTEKFDLVATASAVFTSSQGGLQDGGMFVKYRPAHISLGGSGKLGILFGTGATFPLRNYDVVAAGALGQKAVSVPAKLILQWESTFGLFFNITAGHHFRLDDLKTADILRIQQQRPDFRPVSPPDYGALLLKLGFPARHFYLDAWLEKQWAYGGADYVPDLPDLAQSFGVSYTQVGGTAFLADTPKIGYFLSGAYIFQGQNTSLIRRITLGMVIKV